MCDERDVMTCIFTHSYIPIFFFQKIKKKKKKFLLQEKLQKHSSHSSHSSQSHNTPFYFNILLPFMAWKSKEYYRNGNYRVVTSGVTSGL